MDGAGKHHLQDRQPVPAVLSGRHPDQQPISPPPSRLGPLDPPTEANTTTPGDGAEPALASAGFPQGTIHAEDEQGQVGHPDQRMEANLTRDGLRDQLVRPAGRHLHQQKQRFDYFP